MFDNIERFYQENHYKLIEDKSEGSLRPGKSFTKDVENCIDKFQTFFVNTSNETINDERLVSIIGDIDTNTRHQNLRVMREFGFLVEMEQVDSDGARFRLTEAFKRFVASGDSARNFIYNKLRVVSSIDDLTMYLNLLICTLREAYLYGQVMLFKDSYDKFKADVPSLDKRNEYRERIFKVYGYSGRDKQITDDVYSPNLSYMSRAELENLGLLVMTTKKIDGMNNLVLTTEGYELLQCIDNNLASNNEDPEERNKRLFRHWMNHQVKPEGDSDAGNPYTITSIDQYVSNISTTPLATVPGKSVFYTVNVDEVQATLEKIDASEKKNNTQRSAIRKYIEYLKELVSEEDCEEIFTHNLFGIHIKEKNDALSDEHPHVCIGWSAMGDLSDIDSKDALAARYDEHFDKKGIGRGQDIGQVWRFINDVKVGDYIIFAENSEFHIGRIESEYFYDDSDNPNQSADYKSTRKVRWLKKNISRSVLSSDLHNSLKTAMSIWAINDYKSAVAELLRGTYQKDEERTEVEETVELKFKTDLETPYERNRIVFGAPGTGKSHKLKEDCEKIKEDFGGSFERVTFHPDYAYSQFVGTYKPVMGNDGSIRYDFVPGPFMRVYVDALKSGLTNNPQPYLLIIEEINRAKVAAVFGDVFQLLDRDDDGVSEYEIQASEDIRRYLAKEFDASPDSFKKIRIPNNMFIWSTMNSADQGVFPMDTAFKRRWNFEYLGIDENAEKIADIGKIILEGSDETIEWNRLRKAINAKMSSSEFKINEDKLMGPFFLSKKAIASNENGMIIDKKAFIAAFKSKVIMYLYEDAVKQGKHRFFDGCPDTGKYSAVCDAFDKIGTKIFGATFREDFYDKED